MCRRKDILPLSIVRNHGEYFIAKGQLPREKYANLPNPSFVYMEDSRMKTQTSIVIVPVRFRCSDRCTEISASSTHEAPSTQEQPSTHEALGSICSPVE